MDIFLCFCLLVCVTVPVFRCGSSAAVQRKRVDEKTMVSLTCGVTGKSKVTWSRETVNGRKEDILTDDRGRPTKHINDPQKNFNTEVDSSLVIKKVSQMDSGKYFCAGILVAVLTVGSPEEADSRTTEEQTDAVMPTSLTAIVTRKEGNNTRNGDSFPLSHFATSVWWTILAAVVTVLIVVVLLVVLGKSISKKRVGGQQTTDDHVYESIGDLAKEERSPGKTSDCIYYCAQNPQATDQTNNFQGMSESFPPHHVSVPNGTAGATPLRYQVMEKGET